MRNIVNENCKNKNEMTLLNKKEKKLGKSTERLLANWHLSEQLTEIWR